MGLSSLQTIKFLRECWIIGISWMPRLNAAWDIGGKGDWVIRAGAGLSTLVFRKL